MALDKVIDSAKLDLALTETANAIREKTGGNEPIAFDEMEGFKSAVESIETGGGYDQGYEDGKNSVIDLGKVCTVIRFGNLNHFGKSEVVLNLNELLTLESIFYDNGGITNATVEHLTVNCPNRIQQISSSFRSVSPYDYTLKHITLNARTVDGAGWNYAFAGRRALEIIDGEALNFSNTTATANIFQSCVALVEFRVLQNSIGVNFNVSPPPNLSIETKQSIFDGLATVDTAQTLTLHNSLKILQSQVDSANAKGWTVAGGVVVSEEEYYAE